MKHIPLFKVYMAPQAKYDVATVLDSGFVGQGNVNKQFEAALRDKIGNRFLATTNSATSAEHLAWLLLKNDGVLEEGDEVLTSPLTCFATTAPILLNKLKPKWVDVDPETLNIDLRDLFRKITPKTKAIQLVHWGGTAVDLDGIKAIQEETKKELGFKPVVLEDCAHSWGAKFNGKLLGNHGNICTFSLQAIKHLNTCDGGFITLPHMELFRRAKLLRWYGMDRETESHAFRCYDDVSEAGTKWHMNDVNSAIGLANLAHVDWIVERHRSNAAFYDKELGWPNGIKGITIPWRDPKSESSFWIYSFLVERREDFMRRLKEKGIETSQVHERNDKYTCVKEFKSHLPSLDYITPRLVNIPCGWWIDDEDRQYICDVIKQGW